MNAFLDRLSERERLFVMAGGVVVALVALLQFAFFPLARWRGDMAERRANAEALYLLVAEAGAARGGAAAATASPKAAVPVRNAIADAAKAEKVELSYLNVRPDGAVEANAAGASDALYRWLGALGREYGVVVATADIARDQNGSGLRAQLTLSRPGGAP
jgi:type II secretory pathway component PulM